MLVTSEGRGRVNMEAIVVLYGICVVVLVAGLNQASKVRGKLTFYRDALDFARFKRTAPPSFSRDVFLVETDIEGSTSLWEELSPSVMRRSIDLHNKIMRGLIAVHFGWEVGSEGDAFVIAFHEVKDAAAFCIDLQLSMVRSHGGGGVESDMETPLFPQCLTLLTPPHPLPYSPQCLSTRGSDTEEEDRF